MPTSRSLRTSGALGLALAVLASSTFSCSSGTAPEEEQRVGLIAGFNQDDPRIQVPDTVDAGDSFLVEVSTYGNGCYRQGETEVEANGSSAVVTPWDYVDVSGRACPDILLEFLHQATIRFDLPGTRTVTVVGRERTSQAPIAGEPLIVHREVVVR